MISKQQKQERDVDAEKHVHEHSYPRRLLVANSYLILKKGHRYLPPVVRATLGLVLVVLGFLDDSPWAGADCNRHPSLRALVKTKATSLSTQQKPNLT